jgi:hypothetical protein
MSVTAQNATYLTGGPTASGQVLAPNELSNLEVALIGTVTFTSGAGSETTGVINFIDGTKTLSFTPTGVLAQVIGGTNTGVGVLSVAVANAATATVTFTTGLTNGDTVKILFLIVK